MPWTNFRQPLLGARFTGLTMTDWLSAFGGVRSYWPGLECLPTIELGGGSGGGLVGVTAGCCWVGGPVGGWGGCCGCVTCCDPAVRDDGAGGSSEGGNGPGGRGACSYMYGVSFP